MTSPLTAIERPQTLFRTVQDSIRKYIMENGLKPGDPLPPEGELSKQLKIGRSSVREGVKALEAIGILESRRGTGLFIRNFTFEPLFQNLRYGLLYDRKDLYELVELRKVLELGIIDRALDLLTDSDIAEMTAIVSAMKEKADNGQAFVDEDRRFHSTIYSRLDNQIMLRLMDLFWLVFVQVAENTEIWDSNPRGTYAEHAKMLEAITKKDYIQVKEMMLEGYKSLGRRMAKGGVA